MQSSQAGDRNPAGVWRRALCGRTLSGPGWVWLCHPLSRCDAEVPEAENPWASLVGDERGFKAQHGPPETCGVLVDVPGSSVLAGGIFVEESLGELAVREVCMRGPGQREQAPAWDLGDMSVGTE